MSIKLRLVKSMAVLAAVTTMGVVAAGEASAMTVTGPSVGTSLYLYWYSPTNKPLVDCNSSRSMRVNLGSAMWFRQGTASGTIVLTPTINYYHYDYDQYGRGLGWKLKFADPLNNLVLDSGGYWGQFSQDGLRTLPYGGAWSVTVKMVWKRYFGFYESGTDVFDANSIADFSGPFRGNGDFCRW